MLAGRSFRRRPGRSAMMVAAVGIAVALLVSLQSLAAGFLEARTADVRDRPVDVLLQPVATRGETEDTGLRAAGIRDAHALAARLAATPGVASASPTLEAVLVSLDAEGNASQVLAQGVVPADHLDALSAAQKARFRGYFGNATDPMHDNGSYSGPRSDEVVVNAALAGRHGLDLGGTLLLAASPTDPPRALRVVGIFESPFTGTGLLGGLGIALLPLSELQVLVDADDRDAATRIAIRLDDAVRGDADATAALVARLEAEHPGHDALTKADEIADAEARAAVTTGFYTAVAYVSLVVSALFVASVMVMEVQERRRDLGVLRAIGWSRWSVFRSVAAEALLLVACGTLVGVALGWAGSEALSAYFQRGYGLDVDFTSFTLLLALASAAQSLAVGVLAALYPAWMASRTDPLRVLRSAR